MDEHKTVAPRSARIKPAARRRFEGKPAERALPVRLRRHAEQERKRIDMDLHDGVIQSLYAVVLGLGARARSLDEGMSETRQALLYAIGQLNAIIREVRNCLAGPRLQAPERRRLHSGLQALAEELRASGLKHTELEVSATPRETEHLLTPEAVAHLLHIAREATSNAVRHGGAAMLTIRLAIADGYLRLTVRDDGRGFDSARAARWDSAPGGAGNGLRNMAERARLIGGRLAVNSVHGHGTEVQVEVPLRERMLA